MNYVLVFILGLIVGRFILRRKPKKNQVANKKISDHEFDRIKSMLDDVIVELDDIQGNRK